MVMSPWFNLSNFLNSTLLVSKGWGQRSPMGSRCRVWRTKSPKAGREKSVVGQSVVNIYTYTNFIYS